MRQKHLIATLNRTPSKLESQRNRYYEENLEQEITRLTCIGWSNRQIAKRLNLKVEAVQVHLNGIFCKVGVKSRTELAAVLVKRLRCA